MRPEVIRRIRDKYKIDPCVADDDIAQIYKGSMIEMFASFDLCIGDFREAVFEEMEKVDD